MRRRLVRPIGVEPRLGRLAGPARTQKIGPIDARRAGAQVRWKRFDRPRHFSACAAIVKVRLSPINGSRVIARIPGNRSERGSIGHSPQWALYAKWWAKDALHSVGRKSTVSPTNIDEIGG